MSITSQDFLRSAEIIAAIDASEVHQRNAISRAYYAAYHRACDVIKPDNKDRGVGSHRSYIEQLLESEPGTLARRAGVNLEAVYCGRIKADYKLEKTVSPHEFSTLLNRTKGLFTLFDSQQQQKSVDSPQQQTTTNRPTQLKIVK
jgi:uncharacterized protein (UPF0332 family)